MTVPVLVVLLLQAIHLAGYFPLIAVFSASGHRVFLALVVLFAALALRLAVRIYDTALMLPVWGAVVDLTVPRILVIALPAVVIWVVVGLTYGALLRGGEPPRAE